MVAGPVTVVQTASHASQDITRALLGVLNAINALCTRSQTWVPTIFQIACAMLAIVVLRDPLARYAKRERTQISLGVLFARNVRVVLILLQAVTRNGIVSATLDTRKPGMIARLVQSESIRQNSAQAHVSFVPFTPQLFKPGVSGRVLVFVPRDSKAILGNSACRVQQVHTKIPPEGKPAICVHSILRLPRVHKS